MKKSIFCIIAIILISMFHTKVNAQNDALSQKQEQIITISAFTARGDLEKLKPELNVGLDAGLTVNEIKEVLVHLYAYAGFPRSIRGLQTFMEVLDERKANGVNDNWGREASPINDTQDKYERGKAVLAKLSGVTPPKGKPQTGYGAFSLEIDTFLKEHLFADIFERDVLTYAQREMVTVSVLISLGGLEPMLNSHINLSLNVGITPQQLKQMVDVIENRVSKENADAAKLVLTEVLKNRNPN